MLGSEKEEVRERGKWEEGKGKEGVSEGTRNFGERKGRKWWH